jgi:phytoene synthase
MDASEQLTPQASAQASAQAARNEALASSHYENFPITTRLLPKRLRRPMHALYAFCRYTDDLGDELDGDRVAALTAWRDDLTRCATPEGPAHPILRELRDAAITPYAIPLAVFDRLIEANLRDQAQWRFADYPALLDYCRYSANPVGEMVLHLFGAHTPENVALSDHICTGLQLANFWQDVSDDWFNRQRLYIPLADLARFGLGEAALHAGATSPAWRALMSELVGRARDLFRLGQPLEQRVPAFAWELALFRRGGLAILDAIERRRFDVLRFRPTVSKPRFALRALLSLSALLTRSATPPPAPATPCVRPAPSLAVAPDALLSLLDLLPAAPPACDAPSAQARPRPLPLADLARAQSDCQALVRAAAGNFYPAFRLVPQAQAHAVFALYTFCRLADDLVDDPLPPDSPYNTPLEALAALDANIHHLAGGLPLHDLPHRGVGPSCLWPTLAHTLHVFPIQPEHLLLITDGCRDDLHTHRYATFIDLARYCFKVSSAVSLLVMPVFDRDAASLLPYSLYGGLAVQLTNILRDIPEDAARGRVYLPLDELEAFGVSEEDLLEGRFGPEVEALMGAQVRRVAALHAAASHRLPTARRAQHSMLESIRAIYTRLLSRIDACRGDVFSQRPALSKRQKLSAALCATATNLAQATIARL